MIEITRSLVKQFRTIVRKSILAIEKHAPNPVFTVHGDRNGLRLQAQNTAGTVEFHQPGNQSNETYHLPLVALDEFDGKKETTIQLTKQGAQVTASWREGVVPHERHYDEPAAKYASPSPPKEMTEQPADFAEALQDATDSAAKASEARYGTTCIQLRGKAGDIVATDSRQLLRQSGYSFPWKEDVLVPAMHAFDCRELKQSPIAIGKTEDCVCFRAGPWKLFIAIDKEARFPKIDNILPSVQSATRLRFDHEDARFLTETLSSLPANEDWSSAVTIDAGGQVLIRARSTAEGAPTELALVRSTSEGKAATFAVSRNLLYRAMRLGFRSLYVHATDRPVLFHDGKRDFVTMPLAQQEVVAPDKRSTRLTSTDQAATVQQPVSQPQPATSNRKQAESSNPAPARLESDTETNGTETNGASKQEANGIAALIDEAEALKELLRDAYSRAHTLIAAAKRYRKQARVVNSTLASLRELQEVAA